MGDCLQRSNAPFSSPQKQGCRSKNEPAFARVGIGNVVLSGVVLIFAGLLLNIVLTDGIVERDSVVVKTDTETYYITATITKTETSLPVTAATTPATGLRAWPSPDVHTYHEAIIRPSNAADESDEARSEEEYVEEVDWLQDFEVPWGQLENYEFGDKLGKGEYAEVFQATDLRNNRSCAVKVLKPTEKHLAKREIKILQDLIDGPNIIRFVDVARNSMGKWPSIVTEYVDSPYYRHLYSTFDDIDVRFYMFQLLSALEFAHSKNIMHLDIKPHNVMIDHENRKLRLIDWGLSNYYDPDYSYGTSVGSRFWRAPELLINYEWYNPSSDIWAVGCMMAGLIFEKEPFFRGRSNDVNQLVQIAKILGTEGLFKWIDKYGLDLGEEFDDIKGLYLRQTWESQVYWQSRRRVGDDAFDLLSKLLVYDHNGRLTATEAMNHRYFDPVRSWALSHPNSTTAWDIE
ncbi:Casein kinase II subunit alpha' [Knufia obscura]|uniref:Casein kinase II subunit alpha n=2 Tax=Trichomeriaceae TaxID=1233474 RepID=A0ABR0K1A9_9EURO|nr:Casein kinase II subunit alpha' [Lithohypha guttulata]KAK5097845.1 Casein kinase II subunit alpha' [Lithohypha guttulata]KAK5313832.1 Casein kinase II subunit alpha' [Exophiala xenobiotica]KAK5936596.1 Casein kinase II subunit alpha' [Knufia obscura]